VTLPVAVLCGGKGTRIAALAGDLPKALIPVAGAPFIAHQLDWLRRSGVSDVALLTGYRADLIEAFVKDGAAFGVRVRYSADGDVLRGTAGAIRRALPLLGDTFITIYGDSLLQADPVAVAAALRPADEGVMAVFRNDDRDLSSNVRLDGELVASYDKQASPGTMTHIDYGINVFRASVFAAVPPDRAVDLQEVHQAMIERRTLRAFPVTERWYEIGTPEGLAQTDGFLRSC
jgi:MurNAc alpha-1-phosphate uridylyltransferase